MSVQIAKPENIAVIANFIETYLNVGFNYFGFFVPDSVAVAFIDCRNRGDFSREKIYNKLSELNYFAYAEMYEKTIELDYPAYKEFEKCHLHKPSEYKNGLYILSWHYEMLKHIQFLHYQCDTDTNQKDPTLRALKDLENTLTSFIVSNLPEYASLAWE